VLTAGLRSAHYSQNLPEGQRSHIREQQDPHDSGNPVGNGAGFVKHHRLYLPKTTTSQGGKGLSQPTDLEAELHPTCPRQGGMLLNLEVTTTTMMNPTHGDSPWVQLEMSKAV
jgi:hypothetical protein